MSLKMDNSVRASDPDSSGRVLGLDVVRQIKMMTIFRHHSSPRGGAQKPERLYVSGFFVLRGRVIFSVIFLNLSKT